MTDADYPARRIVAARREDGTEGVISDEPAPVRVSMAMGTTIDIWTVNQVPAQLDAIESARDEFVLDPPAGGLVVRIGVLTPDSAWRTADLSEAFRAIGAESAHEQNSEVPALHATDTVDTATVVSGEVYAVLETSEVRLRPGDTLVQLGTKHAWSNRGDVPAVIVFTQISASRD